MPFKCPDCGTWWSGLEHRCPAGTIGTGTAPMEVPWRWVPYVQPPLTTGTFVVKCTCHLKGSVPEMVICPVHDISTILYAGNT